MSKADGKALKSEEKELEGDREALNYNGKAVNAMRRRLKVIMK